MKKSDNMDLDGLDISIDGVAIPLFLTSLDIFAKSMLVLSSLLQLWEYSKLMPLSFKRPHLDP